MESLKAERSDSLGLPVPVPNVYSWGRSDFGNLFRKPGDDHIDGVYQFHSARTVMQLSSNVYHSAAVTSTGELYTCGENYDGQVRPKGSGGSASTEDEECKRPRILEILGGQQLVTAVCCGLTHTVCVTASGFAISFGGNESGQLGHSPNSISNVPPKIVVFNTHHSSAVGTNTSLVIRKAVAGDLFSLFLTTSGEVYGCGSPSYLGNALHGSEASFNVTIAQRVESLTGTHVTDLVAGSAHVLVLTGTGDVYGWGDNTHCQLGFRCAEATASGAVSANTTGALQQTPRRVEGPGEEGGRVVGMSAGYHHSVLWTELGVLLGSGANKYGQLALPVPRAENFSVIALAHPCIQAACGSNHTLALCKLGTSSTAVGSTVPSVSEIGASSTILYGFGANNNGQITGAQPGSMFRTPLELGTIAVAYGASKLVYISAGGDQSFAIGMPGGAAADSGVPVPGGLLRKQFSTLVSKATVAMSAAQLLKLLQTAKASLVGADGKPHLHGGDAQQLGIALNTASEIFSTPALLAGSFQCAADSEQGRLQREVVEAAVQALQYRHLRQQHPDVYPPLPTFDGVRGYDHTNIYATRPETAMEVAQLKLPEREHLVTAPMLDIVGIEQCYVTLMQLGSTATARLLAAVQQSVTELEYAAATITEGNTLPESALRVLLVLWQAPIMAIPTLSNHIFARILKMVRPLHEKFQVMCAMYPKHILVSRLLKPLHAHLAYALQNDAQRVLDTNNTPLLCDALSWLHRANQVYRFVEPEAFYNERLTTLPDSTLVSDSFNWRKLRETSKQNASASGNSNSSSTTITTPTNPPFLLSNYAFLMPVEVKRRLLLIEDSIMMQHYQQEALRVALMAGANTVMPFFILPIEREHLLQQTLLHVSSASPAELRKPLKVVFIGEEGVDEGGVKKEFFQLLITQLFALDFGMFTAAPSGRACIINMCNTYSDVEYRLVGVLLGLAVYNNVILDVHFPLVLYKLLLQERVTLEDLQGVDPELHKGLVQLLNFAPAEQVEDVFCRSFVAEWDEFGAKRERDLIPDGRNVVVTGENRFVYVDKLVQWILKDSIYAQFASLKEGFHSVVNADSLLLLTADELQAVMVGTPHLDFRELQLTTEYVGPETWNADNPTVRKFWAIIHDLSFEQKQKFLLFVTGSSKAPLGGLKNIHLRIQRMGPHTNMLPTAHTCFNTLLLPEYDCDAPVADSTVDTTATGGNGAENSVATSAPAGIPPGGDGNAPAVCGASSPAPVQAPASAPASGTPTPMTSAPPSPNRPPKTGAGTTASGGVSTEAFMRERILKAISECEGFGLK